MPVIDSLQTLLVEQLKDAYDAEKRLTRALPRLMKKATHNELRSAIKSHLAETEEHVARLERAFEALGEKARAKPCAGMKGLIAEADEHAGEEYDADGLRDATIIGAAQRVEHYEIAAYGTLLAHARLLGLDDVVSILEPTLEEEKAADEKLTQIALTVVNSDAADEADEEEAPAPTAKGRRRSQAEPSGLAADRSSKRVSSRTLVMPDRRTSTGR